MAVLALVAVQSAQAATYYWDVTSPIEAAGFGTAGGTWGTDAFWTTSTTGLTTPGTAATATTDTINFGSTTDGLVAGIISVGTVSAGNITFASGSGAIELSGGTITLAAAETITVNNASDTIGSILAGAGTSLTKLGAGTLTLSGSTANTYTGLTTVNAGTLLLNKSGAVNAIVNGGLTIGSASATAATVQYTGASTNMIGTGAVTINGAGQLDFNGKTDTIGNVAIVATGATAGTTPIVNTAGLGNLTIGSLAMTPVAGYTSRIDTGTGTLTLGGDVTFTAATTGQAQISGNLALGAARTFTVNAGTGANYDMLIDAAISGTGFKLTKAGAGVLTLSGANTFTGGITIGSAASAGGTIRCDAANVLPDFSITMLGGTLNLNGNSDTIGIGGANYVLTFGATNGPLSAGRTSTITTGVGTLTLNGNIYIDSNAVQQMYIEGKLDLGSATRTIQNHTYGGVGSGNEKVPLTIRAVISGTSVGVNLIKGNDGGATVGAIFSGANTYTGTTTINNSTLQLGEGGLTGSLSTSSTITLSNNGTLIFNRSNTITQGTDFNSVIGGSGTVQQKGSGTLILNGANTYNGVTTVNAGKLELAATGTTQTIAGGGLTINSGAWAQYTGASSDMMGNGTVTVNGTGQFDFNGKTDTIGGITINATGATAGTTPVINTAGGGNLTANGLTFTPVAGYTSQINTSTGTLTLGSDVTFNAATTGQAQISGNLALGTATRTFTIALGTGTNYDMLVDATISSGAGGGLSKAGAGRLALSANNTYLGATAVSAGTLILSGNNASATGDIGVTGGAVQFDTTNSINGGAYNVLNRDVTVTSPGAVVFGSSFGAGNIPTALANRIVASSTGAIAPNNYAATNFDFNAAGLTAATLGAVGGVAYTGTLTPNGTTYRLGGGGGTLTMSNTNAVTGGGYSLVVTGTGSTVVLPGSNDYTAGTTLTSGTLAVGNNNALGSGTLTFNGGGLSSDSATVHTIGNAVTFTGNATLGNATNTGKLTFSNTAALGSATRTLTLNSDAQFDGIVSSTGAFGITKAGTGTLTLTQANTYTGATTISGGVLSLGNSLALQNSAIDMVNSIAGTSTAGLKTTVTTLTLGGLSGTASPKNLAAIFTTTSGGYTGSLTALTLNPGSGATPSYSGVIADGATGMTLTKTGAGTQVLSGTNNYTGQTLVSAGTLQLDGSTNASSTVGIGTAGTLTGSGTVNGNATLTGGGIINKASGTIAGTLGVTGGNWNGAGSVTGLVTSSSGTFTIGSGANLTANGNLNVTGGNIAAVAGTSTITGSVNYTSGTDSGFAGVIAGSGKTLTMNNSSSTLTLSGANTYTGGTTVSAGNLVLASNGSQSSTGSINFSGGGTLTIGAGSGGRTFANSMVLSGGTVLGAQDNIGSGGTIIVDGNGVTHIFTGSGSLVLPVGVSANELIVGGGGSGGGGKSGNYSGGGGGGGGKVSNFTSQTLGLTTTVTVGSGGPAVAQGSVGNDGTASSIGSNSATFGKGGYNTGHGGNSGSGNAGGANAGLHAGGGGGDAAVGVNGSAGAGGNGGAGSANTAIVGLANYGVGQVSGNTAYFGGGGGGASFGSGGLGGGGLGNYNSGTANTGGGGGGGGSGGCGAGGTGIAVVQYAYNPTALAGTVTLSGGIDLQAASTLDAYVSGGLIDVTNVIQTTGAGTGGLTIASSSSTGGVVRFGNSNTYKGDTTINSSAILRMNTPNAMPYGSGNVTATGTLDLNGNSTQINGLSGSGIVDGTSGTPTLTVGNNDATSTFGGVIKNTGGTLALTKTGTGTQTLTNANVFTGATSITAGKLKIDTAGTINSTSRLTINGATAEFMYNNSTTAFSQPITFTQGTLSGTGTISTAVSIGSNATLAPGASPGTITVKDAVETWAGGGKYAWQLLDATGTAGTGFDLTAVTGTGNLAVTATSGSPFNIVLQTLSSISPDVQGAPLNWIATAPHSWKIASSANAITTWDVADGVASALFAIDAANFVGKLPTATFNVSKTGKDVFLNYVPEPATLALLALGGLGLILGRKRR